MNWKTEKRNIADLIPAEYNPRQATEKDVKNLTASLDRFSLADPIIINADNKIIGGHFRIRILKEKGVTEVDVRVPDRQLTLEEEQELNLRLNKNLGEWDFEGLANFNEDMLVDVGFTPEELDDIFQLDMTPDEKDDQVPEPRKTDIVLGDMFQLGEHRLLCGDATKKEDVDKLMQGEKADMVFTDPPYGIDYQDVKKRHRKIANDDGFQNIATLLQTTLRNNCALFICCNWKSFSTFEDIMMQSDKEPKACIVWDKNVRIQNLDKFYKQHEFILYHGSFGGQKTVAGDVWRCDRDRREDHPTAKPVELIDKAINHSSLRDQVISDFFGGSGSTLIACEKTNRKCRMMELDPSYCQVIIDRWEAYSGKTAQRV